MSQIQIVSIVLIAASVLSSAESFADVQLQPNQAVVVTCGTGGPISPVEPGWSYSAVCTRTYSNRSAVVSASASSAGDALNKILLECPQHTGGNDQNKLVTVDDPTKPATVFNSCLRN